MNLIDNKFFLPKKLLNNRITYFIVLLLILFNFTSCKKKTGADNRLVYWSSNNIYEIEFAKYVVGEWNKNHPDLPPIKYQPVPEGESSEEIILAAVVGKTTPDIYSNIWQGDVEAYAQAGVLIPLDTLKGFNDFIYQRSDSSVVDEVRSSDGHIYQVPWKINPVMMMYNKKIISNLGLKDAPRTYDEYFKSAKLFQRDANGDGYVDRWIGFSAIKTSWWQRFFDFYPLYLAASNGAPLIKNNKVVFNNKYAIGVFTFLRELYAKNYFPKERLSNRQDVFLSSVIATRFTGPWEIEHANKFKPKGFKFSFSSMPVPDGHKGPVYTYGDPKNIVIFNTSKNPQLAWDFIKFFVSKKNDFKFLKLTSQLPRRKNIERDSLFLEYFNKHPKMKIFAKQSKYIRGTDVSPVLKEVFDMISQEYEASVIYGTKTPEQAINDAAKSVSLLLYNQGK